MDGSGLIQYTEFLAATIEAQGAISEERLAEAFDRFDSDDSGHISVDNLSELLGKDFSRQEIIDIIGDAVDPDNGGDGTSNQMISYSAFLSLWEKNHEKEVRANKLRMLGSQANLCQLGDDGFDDVEDTDVDSPHYSMENCEEAAKARATFLMDKHGTLRNSNAQEQKKLIVVEQPILEDGADFDDSFTVDGGIQI